MITTDYCVPSGEGTPMISKQGISTIPQYICFQNSFSKKRQFREQSIQEEVNEFFNEDLIDISPTKQSHTSSKDKLKDNPTEFNDIVS